MKLTISSKEADALDYALWLAIRDRETAIDKDNPQPTDDAEAAEWLRLFKNLRVKISPGISGDWLLRSWRHRG